MKKKMMMMGVLLCCFLGTAVDAFAGSKKEVDDYLAITTGLTAVTNDAVQLQKGGTEIDHITFNNTSAVTTTVTVAISEVGVYTALVSAQALAPGGTTVVYPRRTVVLNDTTNQTFYVADSVRLINSISATNAATITTRCFIQSRQ
jgi:hypothetical protein